MTTTPEHTIRPGQVWADNDPRAAGRTVRVDRVESGKAACTILTNTRVAQDQIDAYLGRSCPWAQDKRGKTTSIRLDRMRPTSTGYRLVTEEAPR